MYVYGRRELGELGKLHTTLATFKCPLLSCETIKINDVLQVSSSGTVVETLKEAQLNWAVTYATSECDRATKAENSKTNGNAWREKTLCETQSRKPHLSLGHP
jgi:hypothetical protein